MNNVVMFPREVIRRVDVNTCDHTVRHVFVGREKWIDRMVATNEAILRVRANEDRS